MPAPFVAALLWQAVQWNAPSPTPPPPPPPPSALVQAFSDFSSPMFSTDNLVGHYSCTFLIKDGDGWTACLHYDQMGAVLWPQSLTQQAVADAEARTVPGGCVLAVPDHKGVLMCAARKE